MPRGKREQTQPAAVEQRRILWEMTGDHDGSQLVQWDIKTEPFVEALLEIVASGATVVMRPGSGGRSIGIDIWEGDVRHPPKWLYETEEADEWAHRILERIGQTRGQAAD